MIQQQSLSNHEPQLISSFKFPDSLKLGIQTPILNKVQSSDTSFFCGYSNGMILQYNYDTLQNCKQQGIAPQFKDVHYLYQNCDVIDIEVFSKDILLVCTHTEVTLLNVVKNKRICLRGHQQTPIAVSAHPISPLVVSVSNLVIQHDLRMQKPILVNYITPPVYDIQFFTDGQFYFLSGEPCRIGKDKWMRTLENGIGTVSKNSKFIVTNDMNSNLVLWDWKKSQKLRQIKDVKNQQIYQSVHFLQKEGINTQILFLQDDGNLFHHDIIQNKSTRHKLLSPQKYQNWKFQISSQVDNTKHVLVYEHNTTEVKCFRL